MRKLIFYVVGCLLLLVSKGQDSTIVDISSPYKAIRTHLSYLQVDNYNDSIASIPFEPNRRGLKNAKQYAIKLKQVLDGNGIYIYMDEVPKSLSTLQKKK